MALTKEDLQAIGALLDSKLSGALEPITKRLDRVEERLDSITTSQMRVELEQYPRITAALDGVVAGIEKNTVQDDRIVTLEHKADNHDTRINALEATMKKAL